MKYAVVGTTVMNETEVTKALESLWDAADAKEEAFELVLKGSLNEAANDPETIAVIKGWVSDTECLHTIAGDDLPEVDAVLALVGPDPDDETILAITPFIDADIDVLDLASQLVKLEFDSDQVEEAPPEEEVAPPVRDALSEGWPGDDAPVAPAAPEPEKSREVPAKAVEAVQSAPEPSEAPVVEDPATILAGVTENDLDRMSKPELKALVERLGLEADKRSPGSMIGAIVEKLIELDHAQSAVEYGDEADAYFDAAKSLTDTLVGDPEPAARLDHADGSATATGANEPDQTPEEFLKEANEAITAASGVLEVSKGSTAAVVAKYIETIYEDGTVTKVPIADF